MPSKTILLVEDDPAIAEPLRYALAREDWQVIWHMTAQDALHSLQQQDFDFLILDVGLPDMDGFDLCRQIRKTWQTPLLFLTARNDEIERIIGLEIGADDYCAKPFSPREIASRIKAIWRRMELRAAQAEQATSASSSESEAIAWGAWRFDPVTCQIHYHQQSLQLTRYEFRLLELFIRQPERVFSRSQLMQQVWEHPDHSLERTIDSHIKTLRHKLRAIHPDDPIVTHRGLGYSMSR